MNQASQLIASQYRNGELNKRVWGDILYNVRSYGARGDGIHDDTVSIQKALDDASLNGGGTVYLPKGVYIVTSPLFIRGDNINIYSFDSLNAVIKLADNCIPKPFSLIVSEGMDKKNFSMYGIILDGNREKNVDHGIPDANGNQSKYWSGTLLALLNIERTDGVLIEKCKFLNSWGSGAWFTDCTNLFIYNNEAIDYRITGIAYRDNVEHPSMSMNAVIKDNRCEGGVVGIHVIFGSRYAKIEGNHLQSNRDINRFPSYAYGGTYPNVYPLAPGFKTYGQSGYISPAFEGDGAGIECTGKYTNPGATSTAFSSISNNTSIQNMIGIRLEEETRNCSVDANICYQNDKHGIFIFSSMYNTISGNNCAFNGEHGISIEKLSGSSTSIPEQINITGNTFSQNNLFGMNLAGVKRSVIVGNVISDNNRATDRNGGSIQLSAVDSDNCINNIIKGNSMVSYNGYDKYGIRVANGTHYGNFVEGNMFEGFTEATMQLDKNTNKISNNIGYVTTTWGQAYIPNGSSSIVVPHGLPFAPFNGELQVTPVSDIGDVRYWIDSINDTTFTIRTSASVSGDKYFNWFVADDK